MGRALVSIGCSRSSGGSLKSPSAKPSFACFSVVARRPWAGGFDFAVTTGSALAARRCSGGGRLGDADRSVEDVLRRQGRRRAQIGRLGDLALVGLPLRGGAGAGVPRPGPCLAGGPDTSAEQSADAGHGDEPGTPFRAAQAKCYEECAKRQQPGSGGDPDLLARRQAGADHGDDPVHRKGAGCAAHAGGHGQGQKGRDRGKRDRRQADGRHPAQGANPQPAQTTMTQHPPAPDDQRQGDQDRRRADALQHQIRDNGARRPK